MTTIFLSSSSSNSSDAHFQSFFVHLFALSLLPLPLPSHPDSGVSLVLRPSVSPLVGRATEGGGGTMDHAAAASHVVRCCPYGPRARSRPPPVACIVASQLTHPCPQVVVALASSPLLCLVLGQMCDDGGLFPGFT